MFTPEECKKYLNNTELSDNQIEILHNSLCMLIDQVLDQFFTEDDVKINQ